MLLANHHNALEKQSAWKYVDYLITAGHLSDPESVSHIHKYLLACCRRIWVLLPHSDSRRGIVAAERYYKGEISWQQVKKTDRYSEAAAFHFDYCDKNDPLLLKQIEQLSTNLEVAGSILVPPTVIACDQAAITTLFKDAAYFANISLNYPEMSFGKNHKEHWKSNGKFMPLSLFKQHIPNYIVEQLKKMPDD